MSILKKLFDNPAVKTALVLLVLTIIAGFGYRQVYGYGFISDILYSQDGFTSACNISCQKDSDCKMDDGYVCQVDESGGKFCRKKEYRYSSDCKPEADPCNGKGARVGDINADGYINLLDAELVLNENISKAAADIDGNLVVDINDRQAIIDYYNGGILTGDIGQPVCSMVCSSSVSDCIYGGYVRGDINEDGLISLADAIMLNEYISGLRGLTQRQIQSADITGDGNIKYDDVLAIKLKNDNQLCDLVCYKPKDEQIIDLDDEDKDNEKHIGDDDVIKERDLQDELQEESQEESAVFVSQAETALLSFTADNEKNIILTPIIYSNGGKAINVPAGVNIKAIINNGYISKEVSRIKGEIIYQNDEVGSLGFIKKASAKDIFVLNFIYDFDKNLYIADMGSFKYNNDAKMLIDIYYQDGSDQAYEFDVNVLPMGDVGMYLEKYGQTEILLYDKEGNLIDKTKPASDGSYIFVVENGNYDLAVVENGFLKYKSPIVVDNNVVNRKVRIYENNSIVSFFNRYFIWIIYFVSGALLLLFLYLLIFINSCRQSWGYIYDSKSKSKLPRVKLKIYDATSNVLIDSGKSNIFGYYKFKKEYGKFYILAQKNKYRYFTSQVFDASYVKKNKLNLSMVKAPLRNVLEARASQ